MILKSRRSSIMLSQNHVYMYSVNDYIQKALVPFYSVLIHKSKIVSSGIQTWVLRWHPTWIWMSLLGYHSQIPGLFPTKYMLSASKSFRNVFQRMILTSSTKGGCKTWCRKAWVLLVGFSPFLWAFLETSITVEIAVVALIITLIVVDLVVEGLLAFFMLVKLRFGLGWGIVSVLFGTKVGIWDGWWGVELWVDLVTVVAEAVLARRSNVSFEWFLLKM